MTLAPVINMTAAGGTPEQNQDLAKQLNRQIEVTVCRAIAGEMKQQLAQVACRIGSFVLQLTARQEGVDESIPSVSKRIKDEFMPTSISPGALEASD